MDPSREGRLEGGKATRVVEVERFEKILPTAGGGEGGSRASETEIKRGKKAVALFRRLAGRVLARPVT